MIQPIATRMPPTAMTIFGPILSASQPSIGVSQVSSATKIAKATWMSATIQPCALFIGPTNKVQPYCRLAIITMQMMTAMSCHQRWAATAPVLLSAISTPP